MSDDPKQIPTEGAQAVPPCAPPKADVSHVFDDDNLEFVWKVHSYLGEGIRFCDTKAAIVVAWTSSLIGALIAAGVHHKIARPQNQAAAWSGLESWLSGIGIALLAAGFWAAIACLKPRETSSQTGPTKSGLVFWGSLTNFATSQQYYDTLSTCTKRELAKSVCGHAFDLAQIATIKFRWLKRAVALAAVGSLVSGAVVVFFL